jgi:hypothetical protein
MKYDFHTHTIYSDGSVRPDIRIDEAYREGLDAIAFTEHIEGAQKREITFSTQNRSYDVGLKSAKELGIILVRGGEISRQMPPGHINAIFLSNVDEVDKRDWMDALKAAKAQNGFIFWNHPGWERHQPDTTLWWPEHTQMVQQGLMQGIEVVNNADYFPEAHQWCLEKKLTMLGNSDEHDPIFPYPPGKHRTMTLVFARAATPEAILEALNERLTAVYFEDFVIGEEKYLKELFENALEWKTDKIDDGVRVTVRNKSDLAFHLKKAPCDARLIYFRNRSVMPNTIPRKGELSFTVRMRNGIKSGDVNFVVENFLVQPNTGMHYSLRIEN